MNPNYLYFIILLFLSSSINAQTDSLPRHGTIKIGKAKDTIYIKADTTFLQVR
jgi:hypothetical protein